jgi:Phage integrase, N-terminal SAM-like domain
VCASRDISYGEVTGAYTGVDELQEVGDYSMSGQLIFRGDDKWLLRAYAGRDSGSGRRRYKSVTFRGSRNDALARLDQLVLDQREWRPSQASVTVNEFLDQWLERVASNKYAFKTFQNYQYCVGLDVRPVIGAVRMSELSPDDVQRVFTRMPAETETAGRDPLGIGFRLVSLSRFASVPRQPRGCGRRSSCVALGATRPASMKCSGSPEVLHTACSSAATRPALLELTNILCPYGYSFKVFISCPYRPPLSENTSGSLASDPFLMTHKHFLMCHNIDEKRDSRRSIAA